MDSIRWGRRVAAVVLLVGIFGWAGLASSAHELVRIRDDCDPATFNEAIGPGTCEGDGGVTFSRFIAELERKGEHGAWRNNPDDTTVDAGTPIPVVNEGGEFHTLTKVAAYGGGSSRNSTTWRARRSPHPSAPPATRTGALHPSHPAPRTCSCRLAATARWRPVRVRTSRPASGSCSAASTRGCVRT